MEVPPQSLNGEHIYEREAASVQLVDCMLGSGGNKETPVCDDSFGGGKTSLIYKFRTVLDVMLEKKRWVAPRNYNLLREAVYIHVELRVKGVYLSTKEDYVSCILSYIKKSLQVSRKSLAVEALPTDYIDEFCEGLLRCCDDRSTHFLFHFDDVGCFEWYGSEVGIRMIYTIWTIGDSLRSLGHFFAMTGRSTLLRIVGTGVLDDGEFRSPDRTKAISLPPLSMVAVRNVLEEFKLPKSIVDQADVVHTLTSGIPRAVFVVAKYMSLNRARVESVQEEQPGILLALTSACVTSLSPDDIGIFKTCLEMAWAGLYFTDNMSLNGEAITALMARLGIFRGPDVRLPGGVVHFQLVVPPYLALTHLHSVKSLFAIKEFDEKGSRLEAGARRVLHLRFRWGPCANWNDVGLPSLTCAKVPFPTVPLQRSYAFPKIAKNNPWTEADVAEFMDASHETFDSCSGGNMSVEFAVSALPCIFDKMIEGQWYQSLPMAGCADSHIKCAPCVVQFKNTAHKMSEASARQEAKNSIAEGFKVFLVIVCVEGNGTLDDMVIEDKVQFPGVTVILLSKTSVQHFLGENLVASYTSASALVDSMVRLGVSPMKRGNGLNTIVADMKVMSVHK